METHLPPRARRPKGPRDRECGFTLVELMVAATLGALLLVATASSAGMFGRQMEYLTDEGDSQLDVALATIAEEARFAWWASSDNPRKLVLSDSTGAQTTYAFDNGVLSVTQPDGTKGTLATDLKTVSFTIESTSRLREAAPSTRASNLFTNAPPAGVLPEALVFEPGVDIALGFMVDSPAAGVFQKLPGVTEQVVHGTPSVINLLLAGVPPTLGTLTIDLHRARAPGDARPDGPSLGQVTVAAAALPLASVTITGGDDDGGSSGSSSKGKKKGTDKGKGKKLGHFKTKGSGGDDDDDDDSEVVPPTLSVPIDIAPLATQLLPGTAYTFVLRKTGIGALTLAGYPVASAQGSGLAVDDDSGFAEQPWEASWSIDGLATATQTSKTDVASRVVISLTPNAGPVRSATSMLLGQSMAEDPWLGAVPGETAP